MAPDTERIQVLIITDEMEVGGTQQQIVNMVCALDREAFEVTVAYFRNRSFLVDRMESAGIKTVAIPKHRAIDFVFFLKLVTTLRSQRFDIVHCYAFSAELWGAAALKFLPQNRRPALITSVRGTYSWYKSWQWQLKRWTVLQSTRVIANSKAGADFAMASMRLRDRVIDVVYNGVTLAAERFWEHRRKQGLGQVSGGPIRVIFVGRLVAVKNVPLLLRAVRDLRDELPMIHLDIVGDGPMRESLALIVDSLDLAGVVEFLGQRSNANELIAGADILVVPSFSEGLSNVILEAMSAGIPVVASSVGGNLEIIEHMKTGLLFPSDDKAALADAIRCLSKDPSLRRALGIAGREKAMREFSIPALVGKVQDIYLEAVKSIDALNRNRAG